MLKLFGYLLVTSIIIVGFAASLGSQTWLGDILNGFRWQYIFLLVFVTVLFLLLRQYVIATLSLVAAIVFFLSLSNQLSIRPLDNAAHNKQIKVTTFNINRSNNKYKLINQELNHLNSDVVVLEEVGKRFYKYLRKHKSIYPYIRIHRAWYYDYIIVMSKYPFKKMQAVNLLPHSLNYALVSQIQLPQYQLTLIGLHLHNPVQRRNFNKRTIEYLSLSKLVKRIPGPIIIVGDFNTLPWSYYLTRFMQQNNFQLAVNVNRFLPTWEKYFKLFGLPIDHILIKNINVTNAKINTGFKAGSDHYPLTLDIKFTTQT